MTTTELCSRGCCTPEAAALPDGGWTNTDKGWVLDPRRRRHVDLEWAEKSAAIDKSHESFPLCELCGKRTKALDRSGLCPRIDEAHRADRAAWRAANMAGAR